MKLQVEYVPITEIKPYRRNAKLHPQEQIEQIKNSMLLLWLTMEQHFFI